MNILHAAYFIIVALIFVACDAPVAKIIVTNKKMPLTEWPDSLYIASLDSILALEPIKKADSVDANINMNVFKAPIFKLPESVTHKKEANHRPKSNTKQVAKSAEFFANKFSEAMSKLQSDPSNATLYKTVEALQGEDLFKLLQRTYGANVQQLPRFYVLSALQSVNAGVNISHLNKGDLVRIPKL